jgi:hypothetical protein
LVRIAATKLDPGKQVYTFQLIFVESFDEMCYIPSIIDCMAIPGRLIDFIAQNMQNIILFKPTIQISLWACIIRFDGKFRKNPVQYLDLRRVFAILT